jgi:endonuclease YncB( thermonuclease family)
VRSGRSLRPLLLGGLGVAAVACLVAGASVIVRRPPHPGPASGTVSAEPPSVVVVDGETLRLHDTVVRLQGVAAPARGASCRREDGAAYDCGAAATRALAGIVRDRPVACRLHGRDDGGVVQGACEASGTDVNAAIVEAGWARAEPAAGRLGAAELSARAARRGAWDAGEGGL